MQVKVEQKTVVVPDGATIVLNEAELQVFVAALHKVYIGQPYGISSSGVELLIKLYKELKLVNL